MDDIIDIDRLAKALLDPYGSPAVEGFGIPGRCRACGEDGVWSDEVYGNAIVIAQEYQRIESPIEKLKDARQKAVEKEKDNPSSYWVGYISGIDAALDIIEEK